ncbi:transposase [Streptomyces pseudogriseolus]|uniref:transposase n=1 Tax=Streptomyces pseudogriseolus TaxID=36817 RepID=UPI003FA28FFC
MPAPRKYPLELRERVVRMYCAAEPKPVIRRMAEAIGVHHEALRGWIRQAEAGGPRVDQYRGGRGPGAGSVRVVRPGADPVVGSGARRPAPPAGRGAPRSAPSAILSCSGVCGMRSPAR